MNQVHGFANSISGEDSVCDSSIANMNKIILNEANEIVNDYNILDISFREADDNFLKEFAT